MPTGHQHRQHPLRAGMVHPRAIGPVDQAAIAPVAAFITPGTVPVACVVGIDDRPQLDAALRRGRHRPLTVKILPDRSQPMFKKHRSKVEMVNAYLLVLAQRVRWPP